MNGVGIVGVGNMGGAMAARLLEQGWPVQVLDIDRGQGRGAGALGAHACADAGRAGRAAAAR